jgi:hypothetical protein
VDETIKEVVQHGIIKEAPVAAVGTIAHQQEGSSRRQNGLSSSFVVERQQANH